MSLRVGFDLDGTLADFEAAYRTVESRLFGEIDAGSPVPAPEVQAAAEDEQHEGAAPPPESADRADRGPRPLLTPRQRARLWQEIESTPDFWTTLAPIDPDAIPRLHELAVRHRWDVFFITQRPDTAGESVQLQTQRWLVSHGYPLPSVIALKRSRGKLADALLLDFMVDDSAKNCVDIISESAARAILVLRHETPDQLRPQRARDLGIGVAASIGACLDLLEQIQLTRANPSLLSRMARIVGWKQAT
jgi:FMN phosphatase YigB (HAD superfamily)